MPTIPRIGRGVVPGGPWQGMAASAQQVPQPAPRQSGVAPQPTGGPQDGSQEKDKPGNGAGGSGMTLPKGVSVALTVTSVIVGLASVLLAVRFVLNLRFLDAYDRGQYDPNVPNTLTYLNFPEPYLPYHNLGCASFMLGGYDFAAVSFEEALHHDPPHAEPYPSRECQIRINLALALTREIDVESWADEAQRQQMVDALMTARNFLTEDGCANPAKDVFDGHSEDAEQLKRDIDKALERLQDPENDGKGGQDSQDNQQQDKDKDKDDGGGGGQGQQNEDKLKGRLNDRKSDAMHDRSDNQRQNQERQQQQDGQGGGQGGDQQQGGGSQGGGSSGGYGGQGGDEPGGGQRPSKNW